LEAIVLLINIPFEKQHIIVVCDEPRVLVEIKMGLMDYFDVSITAAVSGAVAALVLEMYKFVAIVIYAGRERDKVFEEYRDIADYIKNKSVPVIFLTENDDENDEITAFDLGAADYVIRRRGAGILPEALINRMNQRIRAGENEKRLLRNENESPLHDKPNNPEDALAGKKILIADDVSLNKEIVAVMLSGIDGLIMEFADDGSEAVDKFKIEPEKYALIFMDILMPVMDGLEATRAIRNLNCENSKEVPIIALSASAEQSVITLCLDAGMNDCIEKPTSYDRLIEIINKYCG